MSAYDCRARRQFGSRQGGRALGLGNIMITHKNRRGDVYYLHWRTTRAGKPGYFFSKKPDGDLASTIPEGYEIYEKPNGQVFLRKVRPKLVSEEEIALVRDAVRCLADEPNAIVEAEGNSIVVYLPDMDRGTFDSLAAALDPFGGRSIAHLFADFQRRSHYAPLMRFTLVNPEQRLFTVERWCFRGALMAGSRS